MKFIWLVVWSLSFVSASSSVSKADPVTYIAMKRVPLSGPPSIVKAGQIDQQLDHFSVTDSRTFKQRYWITSTFANGANAPVLLSLCGESECGSSALNYGPLPRIAKETGAYIISLEHRYYGKSQPFNDFTTANLKYLSTSQAIEDIRAFRKQMSSSLSGRWILVGGSYAGNLAAYTRRLYPTEFAGAIASSAPVRPDANFTTYDHHVALLAGRECVSDLQKALAEIESSSLANYESVRHSFNADNVSRRDDFLYLLSDVASAAIQLGLKDDFCQALKTQGVDGYRKMKEKVDKSIADFSIYTAEQAIDPSLAKFSSGLGMRQWFYQSCREYGFWQNAWPDLQESARSHEIDATYHDHLCQRLFGLPGASKTTETYEKFYVPLMMTLTTNVLFTNGSVDPWRYLGVKTTDQFGPGASVYEIPGAFHCEDLTVGGSPAVVQAKTLISDSVKAWLTH